MADRAGEPLEVCCDESGSEGEKLVAGTTDVFAHASLSVDADSATACILRLRAWTRSPAEEYKASVVLRDQNRAALTWLLGSSGPLDGNAHVYLAEKTFVVVRALVDLIADAPTGATELGGPEEDLDNMAVCLYREGPRAVGREPWLALLASFNDLVRARTPEDSKLAAHTFFALIEALRPAASGSRVAELLELLGKAAPNLDLYLAFSAGTTGPAPRLEPLFPALIRAVQHWSAGGRAVSIVHDEQYALTLERIAYLQKTLNTAGCGPLVGLTLVDSRSDPRVQVADLLAGAARRIASEELNGRGDAELIDLLSPYVDHGSVWGDKRSWSRLAPQSTPS